LDDEVLVSIVEGYQEHLTCLTSLDCSLIFAFDDQVKFVSGLDCLAIVPFVAFDPPGARARL
jgi:hypothetical protein